MCFVLEIVSCHFVRQRISYLKVKNHVSKAKFFCECPSLLLASWGHSSHGPFQLCLCSVSALTLIYVIFALSYRYMLKLSLRTVSITLSKTLIYVFNIHLIPYLKIFEAQLCLSKVSALSQLCLSSVSALSQ